MDRTKVMNQGRTLSGLHPRPNIPTGAIFILKIPCIFLRGIFLREFDTFFLIDDYGKNPTQKVTKRLSFLAYQI